MSGSGHIHTSRLPEQTAMSGHSLSSPNNSADALGKFISEQNIAHFRKCLAESADEKQRRILLMLLAGELVKTGTMQAGQDRRAALSI